MAYLSIGFLFRSFVVPFGCVLQYLEQKDKFLPRGGSFIQRVVVFFPYARGTYFLVFYCRRISKCLETVKQNSFRGTI